MRAAVLTAHSPPVIGQDHHGVYRRLQMFIEGLHSVCDDIRIFHFVEPSLDEQLTKSTSALNREQSDYWRVPVAVTLLPTRLKTPGWWERLISPVLSEKRGIFYPLVGQDQVRALQGAGIEHADLIFAHRLSTMGPILKMRPRAPVLFDLDDVEHLVKLRQAVTASGVRLKAARLAQVPNLVAAEAAAIRQARLTCVCSERDKSQLALLGLARKVTVIPNSVSFPQDPPRLCLDRTILFLGNYRYPPNMEAAEFLITNIFPDIRKQVGGAQLIIAGAAPERIPSYHKSPKHVEFTGFVSDLGELYRRVRLICCPIWNGGGTRIKLIEAAANAKPIVATDVGAEGLAFEHDREIVISNSPGEIARACVTLLEDDALAVSLGSAAYRKARANYNSTSIKEKIDAIARAALSR